MAAFDEYLQAFMAIPWTLILTIIFEFLVVTAGLITWIICVRRHPIAVHLQKERNAGRPWVKKGARIIMNSDGTRLLKFLGIKDPVPCPDLSYLHSNATLFFFRPLRMYMREDGVGNYHPFRVDSFQNAFVPENTNMKFFYVNTRREGDTLYNPVKSFIGEHFAIIINVIVLVLCIVLMIVISGNMKDMVIHAADVIGSGLNNIASASSSVNAPPIP